MKYAYLLMLNPREAKCISNLQHLLMTGKHCAQMLHQVRHFTAFKEKVSTISLIVIVLHIFYYFSGISRWPIPPSKTMPLPIPKSSACNCTYDIPLLLIWPKESGFCHCHISTSNLFGFDGCAQDCRSQYNAKYIDDSVVFYNLPNSSDNLFLVHYICEKVTTNRKILFTFLMSYMIHYNCKFNILIRTIMYL